MLRFYVYLFTESIVLNRNNGSERKKHLQAESPLTLAHKKELDRPSRIIMVGNESAGKVTFGAHYPDRLQQLLNRLYKYYEHMSYEDRRLQMVQDIKEMELSDEDRKELLRRVD